VAESMKRKERFTPFLLILPGLLFLILFFVIPMFQLFLISFNKFSATAGINYEVFTLQNYKRFLLDPHYLTILVRTLRVSFVTTLVCLILGYPVAYYVSKAGGKRGMIVLLIFISPLLISIVVRSYTWTVLLAPNGVINTVLLKYHLIRAPLKLMWSEMGITLGMTQVFLSLMILSLYSSMVNIDPTLVRAARNLGANTFKAFTQITLPLTLPGILSGSLLVFTISITMFVIPALLGGQRVKLASYLIYENYLVHMNWPFGAAISFTLLVVTLALVLLYMKLIQSGKWKVIFK
jgi:putative spermidine/putrescine transport system permease protein